MTTQPEPRNPFYFLMLIVGVIFVVTVLAYAVVPVMEEKARDAGTRPPPSPLRDGLREHGAKWVLGELAALVVLGLLCMGLDRYRRWKLESDIQPATPDTSITTKVDSPPPG